MQQAIKKNYLKKLFLVKIDFVATNQTNFGVTKKAQAGVCTVYMLASRFKKKTLRSAPSILKATMWAHFVF